MPEIKTVIGPHESLGEYLKKCWQYRKLLHVFALRDINLRYKFAVFGILWAMVNPLTTTIIISFVFGRISMITDKNIPYPVFVFIGYLFWLYFSGSINRASNSLSGNRNLVVKTYFPRFILPASSIMVGLVDLFIGLTILIPMTIYYQIPIRILGVLMLIPCVFLAVITSLGLGSFYSFLNIKYQDAKHIMPYFNTLLYFLTPIFYSVRIIPKEYHSFVYLNPIAGIVETVRISLLTQNQVNWQGFSTSLAVGFVIFSLGLYFFRKNEKELADII